MDVERGGPVTATNAGRPPTRTIEFESHRTHSGVAAAHFDATFGPTGEGFRPEDGSLAAFLVENYRFYLAGDDVDVLGGGDESGGDEALFYGDVAHPPWDLYEAKVDLGSTNVFDVNGFERPSTEPLAHYSPGVQVEADRVRKLD
jgi:uncharacterized protein YqjF (DUF2071 family)